MFGDLLLVGQLDRRWIEPAPSHFASSRSALRRFFRDDGRSSLRLRHCSRIGAEPAPAELAGSCDDTQAQWIIGKTPTEKDIEQAKSDSKSDAVRSLKPGDAATMDFNPNRLNIILDEKGAVASVNCG